MNAPGHLRYPAHSVRLVHLQRRPLQRRQLVLTSAALLASVGTKATAASAAPAAATRPRIVSVGGALTETLFALGAQGELVGVDSTSLYPPAATQLPGVGYQRTLSAEGVLSLAPNMLIANEEAGPPAALRQIEAAGIPIHQLTSGHDFDGVLARTRRIAQLSRREDAGAALLQTMQQDWQAAQALVAYLAPESKVKRPRVLFLMQTTNQARAAGADTAADALIAYAGARNAFANVSGYRLLSPESAVAAAPDVIVGTDPSLQSPGGIENLLRIPGLAQTPAGRHRRIVSIDVMLALGFGPRLPLAVKTLAEKLYG